jgi:type I restriction enzyme S subunit
MNKQTAKLLEKHFDIALETPDGVKKLRELILTLAMQGKLVEQDEREGTAGELFERIQLEKKQLVKHGKLKAQKTLLSIKSEEVPYKIPQSWVWTRLNDVVDVRDGTHDSPKDATGSNTYPLVTSKDFINGEINFATARRISEEDHKKIIQRSLVEKDDILFSMIGGNLGNQVMVNDETAFSIKNVALLKYYSKKFTLPIFIKKFTEFIALNLQQNAIGGAQPFVSLGFLRNLPFPLPPLPEQKRIVAKIDQLMSLCDKLESQRNERSNKRLAIHTAAINKLLSASDKSEFNASWKFITKNFTELYSVPENVEELKKAILQLAVMGKLVKQDPKDQPASELLKEIEEEKKRLIKEGKIRKQETSQNIKIEDVTYEIPNSWAWVRLNNLGTWKSGSTPSRNNSVFYGGKIPWVKSGEVKQGRITETSETITEKALENCSLSINPKGSVLIAMYGANIGEVGILEIEATTNQAVCACKTYTGIDNDFLLFLLSALKTNFISQGAGAAQPNISKEKIIQTIVPLPPLAEQKRIVAKIDQLMSLCNTLEQNLKHSTDKKSAILNAVLAKI